MNYQLTTTQQHIANLIVTEHGPEGAHEAAEALYVATGEDLNRVRRKRDRSSIYVQRVDLSRCYKALMARLADVRYVRDHLARVGSGFSFLGA